MKTWMEVGRLQAPCVPHGFGFPSLIFDFARVSPVPASDRHGHMHGLCSCRVVTVVTVSPGDPHHRGLSAARMREVVA